MTVDRVTEEEPPPLKQRLYLWLAEHVFGRMIRLLKKTVRIIIVGEENLTKTLEKYENAIFAFWHGNMIIPMMEHIDRGVVVLVSEHGDGEIIAKILESLGYGLVRGSSTRGGSRAFKEMLKRLRTPGIVAFTPDGPTGPYRKFKIGAVILAQRSGVPIIPISASTSRPAFLKSWDRFHVVRPFVRCVIMYGSPIVIEHDLSPEEVEEKRKFVEQSLHALDRTAESYFGENLNPAE